MVDQARVPVYLRIAAKAKHLRELGMSDKATARALGVTDKTVARAVDAAVDADALRELEQEERR